MITIGVDLHKAVHHALALDDAGTILSSWRGANAPERWQQLLEWAKTLPGPRHWGIEGAWNYGRGLAQFLVAQYERVFEVNPRWTAERRRRARKVGKSDRLDAHAVAKLVHSSGSTLPRVAAEDQTAVLDLLVTEREGMLTEATRLCNQLHQLLLQVDPDDKRHLPSLTSAAGLQAVKTYTIVTSLPLQLQRGAAIQCLAQRLERATE
jgi:transposase